MLDPARTTTPLPRIILRTRGAALGVALALALVGCGAPMDDGSGTVSAESVTCPAKLQAWAVGTPYKVGDLVSFKGAVFRCIQAHTPVDGWFPNIVPALWSPVTCSNGNPVAVTPPPANDNGGGTANTGGTANMGGGTANTGGTANMGGGTANTGGNNGGQCVGGPKFDPAGAKNVGNGVGQQFIGGQCLSSKDCASGCCAFPCGICSGPGAQFQAGKQGCGFGG